jgi:hypothetical protein
MSTTQFADRWAKLEIAEPHVRVVSAAVIAAFEESYKRAGRPLQAIVYREYCLGGDRVFWFTPEAAALIPEVIERYGGRRADDPPNIATLKYIAV